MITFLTIKDLLLHIHLGVTASERSKKRKVLLNLNISFSKIPVASKTDSLEDTVCYAKLIQHIKDFCEKKEFKLIEHLNYVLFDEIKKYLPKKYKLCLVIEKYPKIADLGSASFTINET